VSKLFYKLDKHLEAPLAEAVRKTGATEDEIMNACIKEFFSGCPNAEHIQARVVRARAARRARKAR
jgi:hypothetical protein